MKRRIFVGTVFGVLFSLSAWGQAAGMKPAVASKSKDLASPAMQLLMKAETPFQRDLKTLSELVVEPRKKEEWKQTGVVQTLLPSLVGRRSKGLPKHFFVNLFNPFARKEYGYIDPLATYTGPRPGRNGGFDVKTADMQGVPLFGSQF